VAAAFGPSLLAELKPRLVAGRDANSGGARGAAARPPLALAIPQHSHAPFPLDLHAI
jgi:hypothetical protein